MITRDRILHRHLDNLNYSLIAFSGSLGLGLFTIRISRSRSVSPREHTKWGTDCTWRGLISRCANAAPLQMDRFV